VSAGVGAGTKSNEGARVGGWFSVRRALRVTAKDLRLGPRSPLFLWSIGLPVLMTFLFTAVFGSLFAPPPRLAVVDDGDSAVTQALLEAPGIDMRVLDDEATLREEVQAHDVDAGLVLPAGFDAALAAGGQPPMEFYVSGSSLASTRAILGVTTLAAIRQIAGQTPPVEVVVTQLGAEDFVPIEDRLVPFIVFYAVVIAAMFLPAASLVDEREKRTLDAVLVTPTRMSEVLLGKAALGVLLALLMGLVSLALNDAFGGQPAAMVVFLLVGGVMMAEVGLILGCWARDSNTLFSAIKGGGIVIALPAIFFLFPALPQWIPHIVPTYYFLAPIYGIATQGHTLGDHLLDLAVALAVCAALVPAVQRVGRKAERQSALMV
jgi:ABC-2 type transport system permease protein